MSGAAGAGLAGADVATTSADKTQDLTALVPVFNITTRSFDRDPNTGLLLLCHWVDQAVALAMGVTTGKLKSQPTLGNRIRLVKRASGPTLITQCTDAVNDALAALISRKDIVLLDVVVTTPKISQLLVAVSYINLRLTPQVPKTLNFPLI